MAIRSPTQTTHFVEVADNFSPYKIGRAHRHLPEMEQAIGQWRNFFQWLACQHLHSFKSNPDIAQRTQGFNMRAVIRSLGFLHISDSN